MTDVPCPVCGHVGSRWVISKIVADQIFTVNQCRVCNHGFMTPHPSFDLIANLSSDYGLDLDDNLNDSGALKHYEHLFSQYINPNIKEEENRSLLNISNKENTGLDTIAKDYGWRVTTFQFKDLFQIANGPNGSDQSLFADFQERFGLVVFNHVFEHFLNPVDIIALITPWLRYGGGIFVVAPNLESDDFKSQGHKWRYIRIPYHINYFNSMSIDSIFLKKAAEHGCMYEKVFQTSFPPPGHKQGESISNLYRKV